MLVRAARERIGLTLQAVSLPSGVDYSQLSRIERGDFKMLSKNVQKICKYLSVPIAVRAGAEHLNIGIAQRAERVAAQSVRNQRVLEAVLTALDETAASLAESSTQ
jgi:transcriptional regulator with XRE-family HTH domain